MAFFIIQYIYIYARVDLLDREGRARRGDAELVVPCPAPSESLPSASPPSASPQSESPSSESSPSESPPSASPPSEFPQSESSPSESSPVAETPARSRWAGACCLNRDYPSPHTHAHAHKHETFRVPILLVRITPTESSCAVLLHHFTPLRCKNPLLRC